MRKYIKIALFLFTGLLCISGAHFALATLETDDPKYHIKELEQEIEDKKDKIKQIEQSIEGYKNKISEKRLEAVSLSNQMSLLDNRISSVQLDIEATEITIEKLELEIEKLGLDIAQKQQVIARQQKILMNLVRTLYQENDKNMIEVVATFDSFSNFYDRLKYLETVEQDLGSRAQSLRLAKEDLEGKKSLSEEKQKSYVDLKDKLDEKKKDLEEQVFAKETVLAQTQASELKYKTLVSSLRKQYQSIESEIQGVEQSIRAKYAELDSKLDDGNTTPDGSILLSWPAVSSYITAYFHDPSYPYRHVFEHNAIDIRASQGTPIKAAAPGYVARARHCSSSACYSYVMIVHSGGITTVYGHMSQISVSEDQFVGRGEVIGYSGGTPGTSGAGPFVTGPHLHFEVRKNGIPVNPLSYFAF